MLVMVSQLLWHPSPAPHLFIPHLLSSSSLPSLKRRVWACRSVPLCSEFDRRPLFRMGQPLIPTSFNFPHDSKKSLSDSDASAGLNDDDDNDDDEDDGERKDRELASGSNCSETSHVSMALTFDSSEEISGLKLTSDSLEAPIGHVFNDGNVIVNDENTRGFSQGSVSFFDASHVTTATKFTGELEKQLSSGKSSLRKVFERYSDLAQSSDDQRSQEKSLCKVEVSQRHSSSRRAFERYALTQASDVIPSHEKPSYNTDVLEKRSWSSRKDFNRFDFARTFDVIALRVPSDEWRNTSYAIEGHLLNWKGVDNMVRIDGDDLDTEIKSLLRSDNNKKAPDIEDSLLRAVYGTTAPPSSLEKQVRTVEKLKSRDYKNLERISRPRRRILKESQQERENIPTMFYKNKPYMVEEMVPEAHSNEILQNISLNAKRWIGPSRLLLLDLKYAQKPIQDLPMVVQVLLNERKGRSKSRPKREIVPCKLTLFYEYWSMQEIFNELLPEGGSSMPTIKVVGHVAQLDLGEHYAQLKHIVGKVILDKYRPRVKTVINKCEVAVNSCQSKMEVLAGNHSVSTVIMEGGIRFHINLATASWNSDLASERRQLIQKFDEKDIVCDIAAGVGAFVLASAQKVWRVFANDEDTEALKYLAKNVKENRLQAKVELYNLGCHEFLRKLLSFRKPVIMTQVILDLSTTGDRLLDGLKGAFSNCCWLPTQPLPVIHVYGYSDALDPEAAFLHQIRCRIGYPIEEINMQRIHYNMESGKWIVYASFRLPEAVAFS